MKKAAWFFGLVALSGCTAEETSAIGYSLNSSLHAWDMGGFSYHDATVYAQASIPIEIAQKWKNRGFSSEDAKKWSAAGYSPDEARDARDEGIIAPADIGDWTSRLHRAIGQSDIPHDEVVTYANASARSGFTPEDVAAVVTGTNLKMDDTRGVIMAATRVHQGVSIVQVERDDEIGKALATKNAVAEAEKAKASELSRLNKAYGSDVIDACHGSPENELMTAQNIANPYAAAGKCFTIHIGWLSTPQWLNANQALFISNVPSLPAILVSGDGPLKIGAAAVIMGQSPQQYTSALGTLETPLTVRVLKYFTE
ncbi:MAG: hypothetical protein ABF759_14510 [Acetobacter malorum]|uniref:hypothetical protein n=1 Tax=Acetobacter malorum TaxID=178901 RepID=UPI0039EC7D18